MIQKEIKRVLAIEKDLTNMSSTEVENSRLREDFHVYETTCKQDLAIFRDLQQPQHRILSLIEDCEPGTYEELEQLEHRIDYMLDMDWHYDEVAGLKSKYLAERKSIVESGLTVGEFIGMQECIGELDDRDPYSRVMDQYFRNKAYRNWFLWQFMDEIFGVFDKGGDEDQREKKNQGKRDPEFVSEYPKDIQLQDMFKKLAFLVKPAVSEIDREIERSMAEFEKENNARQRTISKLMK